MTLDSDLIENERLEIKLLLEAVFLKYGYDFRNYACAHTKRRLQHRLMMDQLESYSQMQHMPMHDETFCNKLTLDLSINVTEMFRDPWVYAKVRELVVPHLKTYPYIKIWHAGCSAGQEVYSMGILMEEEGIKDRTQI